MAVNQNRAVLVGLDNYGGTTPLTGCINDATEMTKVLSRHYDGEENYDCDLFTGNKGEITRNFLHAQWIDLLRDDTKHAVFFFAGHSMVTKIGAHFVTQESHRKSYGPSMNDLINLANRSNAESVLIILDCCFAGSAGNLVSLPRNHAQLRNGVAILAASRPEEPANESPGEKPHGVFTKLLLSALEGGAADLRGQVTTASLYAFAERALGPFDQRPMLKIHSERFFTIRRTEPRVEDRLLRELRILFPKNGARFKLDKTYEETEPVAVPERVETFKKFKKFRDAGLLAVENGLDLYWAAMNGKDVYLTHLGEYYRDLAIKGVF